MAAPSGGQELDNLDAAALLEAGQIDGDAVGGDEEGPADEPQAASRDHFNQR
jgi:hypothetical protein